MKRKGRRWRKRMQILRASPEEKARKVSANDNWARFEYNQIMLELCEVYDASEMIRKTPARK